MKVQEYSRRLFLAGLGGLTGFAVLATTIASATAADCPRGNLDKRFCDWTPISQMNSLIDALRWRLCYKNQYVEELMEWLAWHTRWVNRNGTDF
ncbi:MAG: hypothetical protein QF754_08670, partial [Alphaproteobacteria bacterium]|nr:hypothetical protein [Alphaproteobacteria bacterium]